MTHTPNTLQHPARQLAVGVRVAGFRVVACTGGVDSTRGTLLISLICFGLIWTGLLRLLGAGPPF